MYIINFVVQWPEFLGTDPQVSGLIFCILEGLVRGLLSLVRIIQKLLE
jgi:hypothetical protein